MYSANGRKKENKENAKEPKHFSSSMVCNKCGFIEENRNAIFGEKSMCNSCTSTDVRFEYK
jgi:hypothetical protein